MPMSTNQTAPPAFIPKHGIPCFRADTTSSGLGGVVLSVGVAGMMSTASGALIAAATVARVGAALMVDQPGIGHGDRRLDKVVDHGLTDDFAGVIDPRHMRRHLMLSHSMPIHAGR